MWHFVSTCTPCESYTTKNLSLTNCFTLYIVEGFQEVWLTFWCLTSSVLNKPTSNPQVTFGVWFIKSVGKKKQYILALHVIFPEFCLLKNAGSTETSLSFQPQIQWALLFLFLFCFPYCPVSAGEKFLFFVACKISNFKFSSPSPSMETLSNQCKGVNFSC